MKNKIIQIILFIMFFLTSKKKNELLKLGADAVEMEGASIAKVASVFNTPNSLPL